MQDDGGREPLPCTLKTIRCHRIGTLNGTTTPRISRSTTHGTPGKNGMSGAHKFSMFQVQNFLREFQSELTSGDQQKTTIFSFADVVAN